VGTPLRVVGNVTRTAAQVWTGPASGPGGAGTLTITGVVELGGSHDIHFLWVNPQGSIEGCIRNSVIRRPHGRWVWDGIGPITRATGGLRRFRGYGAGVAGRTPVSAPRTARIILGAEKGLAGPCR
jgi:hypothetical protein